MGKSANDIMKGLSKDRQTRILDQAEQEIKEYTSLQSFRKAIGMTQTEMANLQGIKQVNISNLENRNDMRLSTLSNYFEAMGCTLEIIITKPNATKARLKLSHNS